MSAANLARGEPGVPLAWRGPLLWLAGLLAFALLLFRETAVSMPATWERSETFAHGWLIVPISLWLVWERRRELARRVPRPAWQGPLLGLGFGLAWLLGDVTGTLIVQQYAFVSLLICACITVLGLGVARAIAFPLGFLYFAVPIGEGLIPPLMDFTADFSVWLLRSTGIPVFQEGTFISLPSGEWSVVEGCSGVRYLIATITLCCLYAWLTYRSPLRRALFMLAAVIVPIIANGLRAYMIMLIGHMSDMKLAGGVDHLLYGWVFFGLVIFLMFSVGAWWREAQPSPASPSAPDATATIPRQRDPGPAIPVAYALLLLAFPAWAWVSRPPLELPPVQLPESLGPWVRAPDRSVTGWEAETHGADQRVTAAYRLRTTAEGPDADPTGASGEFVAIALDTGGELATPIDAGTVHVELSCYAGSRQDAELLNSQNRLVRQKHPDWQLLPAGVEDTDLAAPARVHVAEVRGRHPGGDRLLVWDWWWLGGRDFTNPHYGKLREAFLRLSGQDTRGCWFITATTLETKMTGAHERLRDISHRLAVWQESSASSGAP